MLEPFDRLLGGAQNDLRTVKATVHAQQQGGGRELHRAAEHPTHERGRILGRVLTARAQLQPHAPAFLAHVAGNRRIAVEACVGTRDAFLAGGAVVLAPALNRIEIALASGQPSPRSYAARRSA